MGIEENIVTLCPKCHRRYDATPQRGMIKVLLAAYLRDKYEKWDERDLVYDKWQQIKAQ